MKALILLLAFTLAGCVTTPEKAPIIVTKTVTEVPVEVKCVISYPQEPSRGL